MYLKDIAFKKSTKMTEEELIIIKEAILQVGRPKPDLTIIEDALNIINKHLLKF